MTRAIKFRAWVDEFNYYAYDIQERADMYEWFGHPTIHIEQFTGLLDRNGREIYEGDIISISNAPAVSGKTLVVKFDEFLIEEYNCNKMTGWMVQVVNGEWCSSLADVISHCEVIGTIHENPELLKKGEENS